jgi:hypothetical protein
MTPQYMSTAKKLAILDNDALGQFAEANKNDAMMLAMAMSEKARRDAIKADQMAQAAPMGMQPTVKEQKVAELRQRAGLTALPASNMEAMGTRAAKGGIMTYAGGGFTDEQILNKVRAEAARRGLNPDTVLGILRAENAKLDPTASPETSSAFGLFQTTEATWKAMGGDPKKKTDVDEQIRVGLDLIQDNDTKLGEALGRQPTPTESYTAHVVGLGKAIQMGQAAPDAKVEDILGEAAVKANPTLFKGKTVAQATDILGKKVGYTPTKVEDIERQPMVMAEDDPLGAVQMPEERARTGLVKPKEFAVEAAKGLADIPTAYIPGLIGDVEGLGRLGLRAAGADVSQETLFPGSQQFREAFAKAYPELFGETTDPRRRGIREGVSVAGSSITRLPGAAVRAATKAPTPGLRALETDLAAARQEAAALKDAATPRITDQRPAPSSAKPAVVGPQPMDPAARLAAVEEKRRAAANAARAEIGEPPIPPKPAAAAEAPRPSAEAAEQAAESAARAQRVARDEAAKQLPGAQQKVSMLEASAQKAEEARRAAAAAAPGGARQGIKDLARAATVGAQATMGEPEGGIRDLAKGTAAPIAAMTPDEQAGLASQTAAFARGEEPDFEVGDPSVLGEQFVKNLPKEEQEGLRGLLGKLDNDFYLSLGIGLLSQPDFGQGLAYGTQLYMTRKDAKTKAEAKAKETASEIAEREARTAYAKAQTKVLESGDRNRAAALKQASTDYNKWLGTLAGTVATPAQQRQKLMELQTQQLAEYGLTPVGMGLQSSSLMPGFKLLGQD